MSAYFKLGSLFKGITSTPTAGGTTTLTSTSKQLQQFTGTSTQTVVLPSGTTMSQGRRFDIYNRSTGALTVNANGGGLIATIAAGSQLFFFLTDNTSSAGVWRVGGTTSGGGATVSTSDKLNLLAGMAGLNASTDNIESRLLKYALEEVGGDFWTLKTPVSVARSWPTNFALSGFAYNAGGVNNSSVDVATTDRYDPDNNYFLGRANLNTIRNTAAPFVVGGFAYACGGFLTSGSTRTAVVEQYNDGSNTWTAKTSLPQVEYGMATWALNGYGYVAGGKDSSAFTNTFIYDPTGNAWYSRSPIPTASDRTGQGDSTYNGYGYIVCRTGASPDVRRFSDALDSYVTVGSTNVEHALGGVSAVNGFLVIAGGENSGGTPIASSEQFLDSIGTWVTKSSNTQARYLCGTQVNGLYLAISNGTGTGTAFTLVESYSTSSFINLGSIKRSSAVLTSILASAVANGLSNNIPIQVRTDGDTWKTMTSGIDSILKLGESYSTKFSQTLMPYWAGGTPDNATAQTTMQFYNDPANTWTTRQGMANTRFGHGSFSIAGKSYAFEGQGTSGANRHSSEKYDELLNTWVTAATITPTWCPLGIHGFAILGFGYGIGGSTNTANYNAGQTTNYQYNPSLDSWTSKAVLPAGIAGGYSATQNDRGFVAAGHAVGGTNQSTNYRYNSITDSWATLATLTSARAEGCGGSSLNGFGYAIGGSGGPANAEKYNDATNAWSNTGSLSVNHGAASQSAPAANGFLYAAGNGFASATSEKYNDGSNVWSSIAAPSTNLAYGSAAAAAGTYRNYEVRVGIPEYMAGTGNDAWITKANLNIARDNLVGGRVSEDVSVAAGGGSIGSGFTSAEYYTELLNVWTRTTDSPGVIDGAAPFILQGLLYACSGDNAITNARSYNHITKTWASIANVNTGRSRMYSNAGHSLNGFGYMIGGYSSGAANLSTIEGYNPNTNAWTTKSGQISGIATGDTANAVALGMIYRVGGFDNSGNTSTTAVQAYNDVADSWSAKTNYPNNIFGAIAHEKTLDTFMVMGGSPSSGTYNTASYEYRAVVDFFMARTSLLAGNNGSCFDGKFLFAGGNGSALATTYAYVQGIKNAILGVALEIK